MSARGRASHFYPVGLVAGNGKSENPYRVDQH